MLVAKLDGGRAFHIIRPGEEDSSTPESFCGELFSARAGDIVEDVAEEEIARRKVCKRCQKKWKTGKEPQNEWDAAVQNALKDESIMLEHWNRFFHRERPISWYVDSEYYTDSADLAVTYRYLVEHQKEILTALLTGFLPVYDAWRNKDFGLSDGEKVAKMPPVSDPAKFSNLIQPTDIIVSSVEHRGLRYVGYEFEASWYNGGFGALMWGTHVAEYGEGNIVADDNIAQKDKQQHLM